jgi:type I restriction enzyme S subunit
MFGDPVDMNDKYPKIRLSKMIEESITKIGQIFKAHDIIKYIDITSIDNRCNEIIQYTEYFVENAPSRAQQVVLQGDVLVSMVRPNLKNIAVIRDNYENMIASTGFYVLRPIKLINVEYLFSIVKSDSFAEYLTHLAKGANYPAVNGSDIKNIEIPLPPLPLQNRFAKFVKQADKSSFLLRTALTFVSKYSTLFVLARC